MNMKGSFTVYKTHVFTPNIQYRLFFLDDELVFLKTDSQDWRFLANILGCIAVGSAVGLVGSIHRIPGLGAQVVAMAAFGLACFYISYAFTLKKKKNIGLMIKTIGDKSVEEAIHFNKNNFRVPYGSISKIELIKKSWISSKDIRKGDLIIHANGKKFKFDVVDPQPREYCLTLISSIYHKGTM
jgi:hypothetical protein